MKWLIVLGLLMLVAGLIAFRFRQQIQTALYVLRMFRRMRQGGKADGKPIEKQAAAKDVALVRCAKCGTWVPNDKALNLRSKTRYCSTLCLETAAKIA